MKWLRTLILFDKGNIASSQDWADIHSAYTRAIQRIDNPRGTRTLTLRKKEKTIGNQSNRNGVTYLKNRFLEHITKEENWQAEGEVDLEYLDHSPTLQIYPSMESFIEPVTSKFGGFDFVTTTSNGNRVAIEWETGNISSSHRSLNKLSIVLSAGKIQAGVLILPSRNLYEHLTDRVGNIGELSPYLDMWSKMASSVEKGLLAITIVEHDKLTNDPSFPYLQVGKDGRAAQGKLKRIKLPQTEEPDA